MTAPSKSAGRDDGFIAFVLGAIVAATCVGGYFSLGRNAAEHVPKAHSGAAESGSSTAIGAPD